MPGPRPMPIPLRVLRGNPSKRPVPRYFEPERPAEPPERPSFLTGYARAEWDRIAAGLHVLGLLTAGDVTPLAAYCTSYQRWRAAVEAWKRREQLIRPFTTIARPTQKRLAFRSTSSIGVVVRRGANSARMTQPPHRHWPIQGSSR
jgi:phage terminase small subunit